MDKISKLKEMIVNLKMELIEKKVPKGHCPYTYYTQVSRRNVDCTDCDECRREFIEEIEKNIRKEVENI